MSVPFIGELYCMDRPREDYLTSTGIEPGDLDPEVSKKALVTLIVYLVAVCFSIWDVFVGHGYKNNFQISTWLSQDSSP